MLIQTSLVLLPLLGLCHGDTFTSIKDMENLYDLEQDMAKTLDSYLKQAIFEKEIIEMHYKHLSKIQSEIQDAEKYMENPINAYIFIKRMHYEWPVTFKLMSSSPFVDENPEYPDKAAVTEAIARIVNWQKENKLDTSKLSSGIYDGYVPHSQLTATDCFEIAKYCYTNDKYLAIEWLREALYKFENSGRGSSQLLGQILEYSFLAKCLTGQTEGAVFARNLITEGGIQYTPLYEVKNDYQLEIVKKCEAAANESLVLEDAKASVEFLHSKWTTDLCYASRRSTKPDSGACYILIDWSSANFLKLEEVAGNNIQIIYDFLPTSLIIDMKLTALEQFERLDTKGLNGPISFTNKELTEAVNDRLINLGIRKDMLGKDHQIYINGPGGFQAPLSTYLGKQGSFRRMGTLFYFLNDVAQGGNLIFLEHAVSIEPSKGTLLLWEDGAITVEECPVSVGFKWGMTQSIVR